MNCAFCGATGTRRELHAHLTDVHDQEIKTWEAGGRRFYELKCPECDAGYLREVKPRLRDPGFLEEYAREIRLVAFDLFLYHWEGDHMKEADHV